MQINRLANRTWIVASLLVTVLLAALLAGCGGSRSAGIAPEPVQVERVVVQEEVEAEFAAAPMATQAPAMESPAEEGAPVTERLIIRTGSIAMEVEDTLGAKAAIEDLVASMAGEGAYVVSANEYGGEDDDLPYIDMAIRVPATRYGQAMDQLAALAVNVVRRNETAQDVTEEYVDLEARLESLEAARQRLLAIMEEARSTEDLLQAEQQLTQREAEIESIKGRMQYLSQSAALALIQIELQPYLLSQPVGDSWKPLETVRRAVDALIDGLRGFADFLIFFAIALLPWLLLLALALYIIYRVIRRVTGRKKKDEPAA
jgi:hypothetical protein